MFRNSLKRPQHLKSKSKKANEIKRKRKDIKRENTKRNMMNIKVDLESYQEYICIPIYGVTTKTPLLLKQEICNYTPEGRKNNS